MQQVRSQVKSQLWSIERKGQALQKLFNAKVFDGMEKLDSLWLFFFFFGWFVKN
jgi:hypothetical protein